MSDDNDAPTLGVGREDFHERREARVDRLRARAVKRSRESEAGFARARVIADAIPMGQPILVGHHSERRHRRDIERIDRGMRTGVEKQRDAAELARRADSAESNDAISADDPAALQRLRAKLEGLEHEREQIKAFNLKARTAGTPHAPAYVLSNLGANIRRVKERIVMLEKQAQRTARSGTAGVWEYTENADANRMQVRRTDGQRCTASQRSELKRHGFRWAPSETAWQRKISESAWYWGKHLAERFAQQDAPAALPPREGPEEVIASEDEP